MHVITRLFNTSEFFIYSATIMPVSTLPVNQLIAITAFDNHFKSSSVFANI